MNVSDRLARPIAFAMRPQVVSCSQVDKGEAVAIQQASPQGHNPNIHDAALRYRIRALDASRSRKHQRALVPHPRRKLGAGVCRIRSSAFVTLDGKCAVRRALHVHEFWIEVAAESGGQEVGHS
jgi:hypothetical protein